MLLCIPAAKASFPYQEAITCNPVLKERGLKIYMLLSGTQIALLSCCQSIFASPECDPLLKAPGVGKLDLATRELDCSA